MAHPFILLLTGALISGGIVTILTQKWQNKKHQFEVKIFLVNQISEVSTLITGVLMLRIQGGTNREKEENAIIQAEKLEASIYAYFPDKKLSEEWYKYTTIFINLWDIALGMHKKATHDVYKEDLDGIKKYFIEKFPDIEVKWDKIKNQFSASEFFTVRSTMFKNYRYFVKKVTDSDITIF